MTLVTLESTVLMGVSSVPDAKPFRKDLSNMIHLSKFPVVNIMLVKVKEENFIDHSAEASPSYPSS